MTGKLIDFHDSVRFQQIFDIFFFWQRTLLVTKLKFGIKVAKTGVPNLSSFVTTIQQISL